MLYGCSVFKWWSEYQSAIQMPVAMMQGICSHSLRTPNPRESAQARLVNQFFLELYMSAAEPLPHEFKVVAGDGHQQDDEAEPWEIDDDLVPRAQCASSDSIISRRRHWHAPAVPHSHQRDKLVLAVSGELSAHRG